MKKLILLLLPALLGVGSMRAQQATSIPEEQYPGDLKAEQVFQTGQEKQVNKKTSAIRTTWLANRPRDNWFITLEGGVASFYSENHEDFPLKENIKPTFGLALGKWLSPVWGMRLDITTAKLTGYNQGATAINDFWYVGMDNILDLQGPYVSGYGRPDVQAELEKRYLRFEDEVPYNDFSYAAATVDILLNLKNIFRPYNPKSFFDPVIYGGIGYAHTFGSDFDPFKTIKKGVDAHIPSVSNMTGRAGIQLNFRLCDAWKLNLNAEGLIVPENFDRFVADNKTYEGVLNIKLGLTYGFNFRHFMKPASLDETCDVTGLNDEINRLRKHVNVLNDTIDALRNRPVKVVEKVVVVEQPAPVLTEPEEVKQLDPVFYLIDSSVIRESQIPSVAKAAEYLATHPGRKLGVTSYADVQTANPSYNLKLSKRRSQSVVDMLINKYGVDK
ncbi:MAG: hypothetical protein LBN23_06515, partial [Paludibacter sp.]|nr:hypothetical protein [Paludibacter sp.]